MADHSKWTNIRHRKAATNAKRDKIWTHLIGEITMAAHPSNGDVNSNPRPCLAIDRVTDANMPRDSINRIIQRDVGGLEGAGYGEVHYEGYGINGAVVIVDCLTNNYVRTAAGVRYRFDKYDSSMGALDSVTFLFDRIDQFIFAPDTPKDKLMGAAFEAGIDDVTTYDDDSLEVIYPPRDSAKIETVLGAASFKAELAEVIVRPQTGVVLTGEDAIKMQELPDVLENLGDAQGIFTNVVTGE